MVRRLLHLVALIALVLAGPAQGLLMAGAQPAACCCCGGEAGEPSPCGMPKAPCGSPRTPCAPQCPGPGTSRTVQAPVALVARVRAAQVRAAAPRKEPAPWPATLLRAQGPAPFLASAPAHAPPLPLRRDSQATLSQFRI
ncbi:hypothetical protein [Mesoterricola silvestris]|uniref:Uncharacterized protein n=1 Tax=Mesoterricola silvestris TaxID=2927979 RepID=A0AA48GMI9_9BACT|nr:hypothetical protein [Mesoterricola silvestris]BDU74064.1 hypothetical protein METEAL_32380 [Mesoterricola silvestris]